MRGAVLSPRLTTILLAGDTAGEGTTGATGVAARAGVGVAALGGMSAPELTGAGLDSGSEGADATDRLLNTDCAGIKADGGDGAPAASVVGAVGVGLEGS